METCEQQVKIWRRVNNKSKYGGVLSVEQIVLLWLIHLLYIVLMVCMHTSGRACVRANTFLNGINLMAFLCIGLCPKLRDIIVLLTLPYDDQSHQTASKRLRLSDV